MTRPDIWQLAAAFFLAWTGLAATSADHDWLSVTLGGIAGLYSLYLITSLVIRMYRRAMSEMRNRSRST